MVIEQPPPPAVPAELPPPSDLNDDIYAVKRTQFLGKPVTYICQNINGPCPLLAISNLLLLRGHISIDAHVRNGVIAASDLIEIVRKRLIYANPPLHESDELGLLTQQKTIAEVYDLMPSLLVGLDVNVRFHSITDFEYTAACAVFDMLDIALVHGWLLDIQDEKTHKVIQNKSYNELIERLVDYRGVMMTEEAATPTAETEATVGEVEVPASPAKPTRNATQSTDTPDEILDSDSVEAKASGHVTEAVANLTIEISPIDTAPAAPSSPRPTSPAQTPKSPSRKTVDVLKRERQLTEADAAGTATALLEDGPILEEFFAVSASQLTYYGLVKLHEDLRERQLAVFFRNNHFATLLKHDGALYLLVTDAGYLDEPTVVWERLNEIDGDSEYFDANFRPLNASETRQQTIFRQQEEARRRLLEAPTEGESAPVSEANTDEDRSTSQDDFHPSEHDPDYLLALKFQQEEERALRQAQAQIQPSQQLPLTTPSPQRAAGTMVALPQSPIRYAAREPSEGCDSLPPSQGPNSSSEGDAYAINANGDLVLSDAELQAQQEAALYYEQQRKLQQARSQGYAQPQGQGYQAYAQPQGQGYYVPPQAVPPGSMRREYDQRQANYAPNRAAPPARNDQRRESNDCSLM